MNSFCMAGPLRRLLAGTFALALLVIAPAAGAAPPGAVERGRYLVESILGCGNCHTPKSATGVPVRERHLSGGGISVTIPPFAGTASNITPDRATGIGTWSDAQIKRALTEGMRPDHGRLANTPISSVMPAGFFKALLPRDLDAVVAYLRSVKPIRNEVALPVYKMPVRHDAYPDAEAGFTEAMMSNPVQRGKYLVTIGHCMECHSPLEKGAIDYTRLGRGGRFFGPEQVQGLPSGWAGATSRNITSHPVAGLGAWSDAQIKRAITRGISRDGRPLLPPMGFAYYARMTPRDLDAIVAYLRTVAPQE